MADGTISTHNLPSEFVIRCEHRRKKDDSSTRCIYNIISYMNYGGKNHIREYTHALWYKQNSHKNFQKEYHEQI